MTTYYLYSESFFSSVFVFLFLVVFSLTGLPVSGSNFGFDGETYSSGYSSILFLNIFKVKSPTTGSFGSSSSFKTLTIPKTIKTITPIPIALDKTALNKEITNLNGKNAKINDVDVNNPSATERFQPGDRVVVNGSVSDIEFFKIFVDTEQLPNQ